MLIDVYDSKGELFEVPAHVAKRLIIDEGWAPTRPQVETALIADEQTVDAEPEPEADELDAHPSDSPPPTHAL